MEYNNLLAKTKREHNLGDPASVEQREDQSDERENEHVAVFFKRPFGQTGAAVCIMIKL